MPVLHPAEIWKRSGRYDIDVVFKLRDRSERDLVLAITHEEIVALHASQTIRSYRDLPQIWYHIQLKERDEPRPAGGVLRTREFTMKDSYTLDRDQAGLDEAYALHEEAYDRIYRRCGLEFYKVESDTGIMGGSMAPRVHGALERRRGPRGALQRAATTPPTSRWPSLASSRRPSRASAPVAEVETPGVETIEELAQFLGVDPRTTVEGHARHGGRRQGLARARARRPAAARAQAQQGARPGHAARHARGDRGRLRRQAGLDRPCRRRGRLASAASSPTRPLRRRLLGHGRQPHRLASHRRRGRPRLRGRSSPTCTRSRTATPARSATACCRSSR